MKTAVGTLAAVLGLVAGVAIGAQVNQASAQSGPTEVRLVDTRICTDIEAHFGRIIGVPEEGSEACDAWLYLPNALMPQENDPYTTLEELDLGG